VSCVCPSALEKSLLEEFQQQFAAEGGRAPEWAEKRPNIGDGDTSPIPPPIPLVGHCYRPGYGILVYASAENLNWGGKPAHERCQRLKSFRGEHYPWVRYRHQLNNLQLQPQTGSFPDVGIQPVSDGGLLCAARFIARHYCLPFDREPRSLLDTIAVTNWCKFVWAKDYAGCATRMRHSLPYVERELRLLRPRVVLLPYTIWREETAQQSMRRSASKASKTLFLPVPQFNRRVAISNQPKLWSNAAASAWPEFAASISATEDGIQELRHEGLQLRDNCSDPGLAVWVSEWSKASSIAMPDCWRFLAYLARVLTAQQSGDT